MRKEVTRYTHVVRWLRAGAWGVHRTDFTDVTRCGAVIPPDAAFVQSYHNVPSRARYVLCFHPECYGEHVDGRDALWERRVLKHDD